MTAEEIRKQLDMLSEPDFREFTAGLMPGVRNVLGVRLPALRRIAKQEARGNWKEYFEQALDDSYEEIMLQGMVIGYLKEDLDVVQGLIRDFVPKIDNWSVCDSFCSGLKITKEYPAEMWEFIQDYFKDKRPFCVRFAIVMLLQYFVDEEHIEADLEILDRVCSEEYYVKMAVAWAISICFIRFEDITLEYLKRSRLDDFTYNKALAKITESLCVDKETKQMIRSMKRK
ncbi:DNA alkylation repair protein [Murimonas intestini]|mgnify:FL=1|uniref:DNA alkylation repair protein n=1 Tax=Murimonas intestini TaxID=1337051 RepID=UPI0011DD7D33|nr:DNA alkylation repair protein [Murimonas intestini]